MRYIIQDQELLFQRIERAQKAILNAKRLDKANGGRTIEEIWHEMGNVKTDYYSIKELVIDTSETLNANPTNIPGDFVSSGQLMAQMGNEGPAEVVVVDGMELEVNGHYDKYLTNDILRSLTQLWLELNGREIRPELEYYYNDTFRWNVLDYQRRTIETVGIAHVDFIPAAEDRPLVYAYNPEEPVKNPEELDALITNWKGYEKGCYDRMNELSEEEKYSDRGPYIVDRHKPYGELYVENNHVIFEVSSRMFWDYVELVYRLSDEHPECFGQGASVVIDKLYEYYKVDFLGDWDLSRQDFELKAIGQFLYISNDDRQIRIDLFRQIDPKSERVNEVFTGGLYHVFDHFKGLRVSSKSKGDYALDESRLLETIRDLFFSHATFKKERLDNEGRCWGHEYIAEGEYDTPMSFEENKWQYAKKKWKGAFVLDLAKDLFYLNTLYITNT